MFDFEKLKVYQKAKGFNKEIKPILEKKNLEPSTKDQLRRASLSIILNIAEGSSRFTKASKKNFYIIARGSAYECAALMDVLKDGKHLEESDYQKYSERLIEISKMLYALIQSLKN